MFKYQSTLSFAGNFDVLYIYMSLQYGNSFSIDTDSYTNNAIDKIIMTTLSSVQFCVIIVKVTLTASVLSL